MNALTKKIQNDSDASPDYWQGMVIYQIYPLSFKDSNGDGFGDLPGIAEELDYIADLGVDAIWISPFFTSPMKDFGYDISDYSNVDPTFGTLEDFDRLIEKAHKLGLKVIIDQVYSHTSDRHDWFRESRKDQTNPKADWYVWADPMPDGSPPNNWQSVFMGSAWSWDTRRRQYYLHNFLREQPDLNLHNPEVQQAIIDVARFWLDRGVDGFRMDAVNFFTHNQDLTDNPSIEGVNAVKPFDMQTHIHNQSQPETPAYLERLRKLIDSYPGRFTIAEIGGENALAEMKEYTEADKRLHTAYSFDFIEAPQLNAKLIRDAAQTWITPSGEDWPSFTFSNHDRPRSVTRWARNEAEENDPDFAKFLNMLLLSIRGCICMYQGEELGLPQATVPYENLRDPEAIANWPETLGRDGTRTPMPWVMDETNLGFSTGTPWLPLAARHGKLSVSEQEQDLSSCLGFTKKMLAIRNEHRALKLGNIRFTETSEPILAFERYTDDETLLCLFNTSAGPAMHDLELDRYDVLTSHKADQSNKILPATSGLILKQRG